MTGKHEEVVICQSAILAGIHQLGKGQAVASGIRVEERNGLIWANEGVLGRAGWDVEVGGRAGMVVTVSVCENGG